MRLLSLCCLSYLFLLLQTGCGHPVPESASFVATLGRDTLVIEKFSILPERVEAEVLLRTPHTLFSRQSLHLDDKGRFQSFSSATYNPDDIDGSPVEEQNIVIVGDSLLITLIRDTLIRNTTIRYESAILPWLDMVHWPYEVATRQIVKAGEFERDQLMLAGSNPAIFEFRRIAPNSISIKHPFRGTMYANIDDAGAILQYDATATTRKLVVTRGEPLDMQELSKKYANKAIGSLSGEGLSENKIHGANIRISFGQPSKRGRELFGGIVPWNEVWRTGANRATHFRTDRDLRFGALQVPAGEYTLYSIPAPEGGILIFNSETGQNGNTYDAAADFGRVPMKLKEGDENVELFTIDAVEQGDQGVLKLMWGNTIFEISFIVSGEGL